MTGPSASRRLAESLSIDRTTQLQALAHPLRQRLIEYFARKPATTKQAAEALGCKPTRLYHHVARLQDAGLVRIVDSRPVRGTTEKYYSTVATRLRVDRRAFSGESGRLLEELAGFSVIDSLLDNVRSEVAEYLAATSAAADTDPDAAQEVLFGQVEIEADAATAAVLRDKIDSLLAEFESRPNDPSGDERCKYRFIAGWYPRAK